MNPESEIIGLMIDDNSLIGEIRARVSPGAMSDPKNREVYRTILELSEIGSPIDKAILSATIVESSSFLKDFGGNEDAVRNVVNSYSSSGENYIEYCNIINSYYHRSHAKHEVKRAEKRLMEGESVIEVMHDLHDSVDKTDKITSKPFQPFSEVMQDEMLDISTRMDPEWDEKRLYVPSPFRSLNHFIRGFRYGTVSLLGARPSMGKTTFAINCMVDAVNRGVKTLFISIEMNKSEIAQKVISHSAQIPINKIIQSSLMTVDDHERMAQQRLDNAERWGTHLVVNDSAATPSEVLRTLNWGVSEGYQYIIIDHLHELSFDDRRANVSLTEAMGNFVKHLRNVAKRDNVALLALCQLNREVEKRQAKIPMMSDLGETGALERTAYNILFLYRDEVYNPGSDKIGECDVVIAKARSSSTGILTLDFDGATNTFKDQI